MYDGTRHVWKLKKALYGLQQAARQWHKELALLRSELGLNRCHTDPALFGSKVGRCLIFLWVDDQLIFSEKGYLQPLVDEIHKKFDGRDLKEVTD